ncbi:MAG: hypothetical protein K6C94_07190 [Candidatus Gastranaerophilales bacterium]|nr:hypothetical protein [Candidatus Gastranaerophilales bacterium]
MYNFSILIAPIIMLIFNFLVARRTKRFDVAVFAFLFYCFCIIPSVNWVARESYTASMLQFIFLQYYLSKEKFQKADYVILLLVSVFLCESFENIVILSIIFFIFGCFFYFKDNTKRQLVLGLISLLAAFYIGIKSFLVMLETLVYFDNIPTWNFAASELSEATFNSVFLISIAGLIALTVLTFCKKLSDKKNLLLTLAIFVILTGILYANTRFIPNPLLENNLFLYALILQPVLFVLLITLDCFKIKTDKEMLRKILIITCITGSLQLCWQINSAMYRKNYINTMTKAVNTAQKPFAILNIDKDIRWQKYPYDITLAIIDRSILCSGGKVKSIVIVNPEHPDYISGGLNYTSTYFDEKNNIIYFNNVPFIIGKVNTDLSEIAAKFKKLGLTKSFSDAEFLEKIKNDTEVIAAE